MDCEILTVGNELLLGFVVDTNAAEAGQKLAAHGIRVLRRGTVGDEHADIVQAVRAALDRSGTVIITGGLGPTRDDITKVAVAEVFGRKLVRDDTIAAGLEDWFKKRGISPLPPSNLGQADVPEGATVLPNTRGTAPGLLLEDGNRRAFLLPGVPKEMRGLLEDEVIPRLKAGDRGTGGQEDGNGVIASVTVRTAGIGESALHDKVGDVSGIVRDGVTLAWLPANEGVDMRLTSWTRPETEARAMLEAGAKQLADKAGGHAYGRDGADLAKVVLDQLAAQQATLATAESCTGGLVGARLTAIPGSSKVFVGGVVAYANDVKLGFLGVSADTLAEHGAVSEAAAREMAAGAARAFDVRAAVAVTGIAGPDGGTDAKPVGTVWIAVWWKDDTRAFHYTLPGDREDVRRRAAQLALDAVRRVTASSRG